MLRHRVSIAGAVVAWSALMPGLARAVDPNWVSTILPERAYDFGTVARGSQIRHAFELVNRTDTEVRIADTRTKCGCTDVKLGARVIPPGTKTTIEATIDTTKFVGYKASGLTLILSYPTYAEVDLNLTCFIRSDIVLNPGQLDFGVVRRGKEIPAATLTLSYGGGSPDWAIQKSKHHSPLVKVEIADQGRSADGQIHYLVTAKLDPEIPTGPFKDEITLTTNDTSGPTIPISLVANVQGAVAVTPGIINSGSVRAGQTVTRPIIVRGAEAFNIEKMTPSRNEIEIKPGTDKYQPLHTVTLSFKAPSEPGPYHATVSLETSLEGEPAAVVKTFATIVP
jgi:hypothetical protein